MPLYANHVLNTPPPRRAAEATEFGADRLALCLQRA